MRMNDKYVRLKKSARLSLFIILLALCGGRVSTDSGIHPVAGFAGGDLTGPGTEGTLALIKPPSASGVTAIDGIRWINYRRIEAGLPILAHNLQLDKAAQNHSNYQKNINTATHFEDNNLPVFTGATLNDRLTAVGVQLTMDRFATGEVIGASAINSGFYLADELLAAIYHRYVIFEPTFKEIGTGVATSPANFTYFTANFLSNNGFGTGAGGAGVVVWPAPGQKNVRLWSASDEESPDPVPNLNVVGYPISVHANIYATLSVSEFTIMPKGGDKLKTILLQSSTDINTPRSAVATIPLEKLAPRTIYDVKFIGRLNAKPLLINWSFTTK